MLDTIGLDDLDLVPYLNGEKHTVDRIALLDLFQDAGVPGSECCCFVKAFLYGFEKFVFHLACLVKHRGWVSSKLTHPRCQIDDGPSAGEPVVRPVYLRSFSNLVIFLSSRTTYSINPSKIAPNTKTTT
jgi:hypothetical protein